MDKKMLIGLVLLIALFLVGINYFSTLSVVTDITNQFPQDGAIVSSDTVTLEWSGSASSYDVYFGTTSPPGFYETTTSNSITITNLDPSAEYFWYVSCDGKFEESLVETINVDSRLRIPSERLLHYADGKYWFFYGKVTSPSTTIKVHTTSVDGINWDAPTFVCDGQEINSCADIDYEIVGNNVYYIKGYGDRYPLRESYFRKGLLNADGSITWNDEYVMTGLDVWDPIIEFDTGGDVWIAYYAWSTGKEPEVSVSEEGSTFVHKAGFPLRVNDLYSNTPDLIALDNGDMYILSVSSSSGEFTGHAYGYYYGTSIGPEETLPTTISENYFDMFSTTNINNDVHFVCKDFYDDIVHLYRDYDTGEWIHEGIIAEDVSYYSTPLISKDGNILYCTYISYGSLYTSVYENGEWSAPYEVKSDVFPRTDGDLQTMEEVVNGDLMISYMEDNGDLLTILYNPGDTGEEWSFTTSEIGDEEDGDFNGNGNVDANDVYHLAMIVLGESGFSTTESTDVNSNGLTNAYDVYYFAMHVLNPSDPKWILYP